MKALEVTMQDMFTGETDTVILQGNLVRQFNQTPYKSDFLLKLETVGFESPYVIDIKKA